MWHSPSTVGSLSSTSGTPTSTHTHSSHTFRTATDVIAGSVVGGSVSCAAVILVVFLLCRRRRRIRRRSMHLGVTVTTDTQASDPQHTRAHEHLTIEPFALRHPPHFGWYSRKGITSPSYSTVTANPHSHQASGVPNMRRSTVSSPASAVDFATDVGAVERIHRASRLRRDTEEQPPQYSR